MSGSGWQTPSWHAGPHALYVGCADALSTTHRHSSSSSGTRGTHGPLCTLQGEKKDIRRCQRPEAPPRSHEFGISGVSEPAPCSAPRIRATVTISSYWCLTASLNALSTGARNKPRGEPLHIFSHKETLNPKPLCQHSPSRLCLLVFQWDQQGRGRQGLQEHREHPQGRSHHDHPASRQQRGQICAKPHSFWHGDGECQWGAHGKLTFTPAAPSLPGGPSAPGLP